MSDSGDSSVSRKKSFSSRFSSKMDKLSNPFKKGDNSDSDSEDDSSSGKSRSLFGGKLHNPFKKGHSSDSDDEDDGGDSSSRSPQKGRKFSRSGKSAAMMPSHSAASPQSPEASTAPVEAGLGRGEAPAAAVALPAPIPDSKPPAVLTSVSAVAPPVPPRPAPAKTAEKAPAGTTDAVRAAEPARATATAAPASTTAAATTDAAASSAAAAASPAPEPEPEPKKPRETVGGPVFGAPEILLTGVKGDPDEVMKTLRARGFVVHLVRVTQPTGVEGIFFYAGCASLARSAHKNRFEDTNKPHQIITFLKEAKSEQP